MIGAILMIGIITGALGLLATTIQSDDQKQIALQQSKNQRNVELAKTVIEGAVAAYGIYSQMQQSKQNNIVQPVANVSYQQEIDVTPNTPMLGSREPVFNLNYDSIWMNRSTNEMGADVIEENSGEIFHLKYRMQSIGNKVYKIYECVNNGDWEQVGVIDWKCMSMADLGRDDNGGPFFAEIARTVMRKR